MHVHNQDWKPRATNPLHQYGTAVPPLVLRLAMQGLASQMLGVGSAVATNTEVMGEEQSIQG